MWEAPQIGHIHTTESNNGKWNCEGSADQCQDQGVFPLQLEVVSTEPKVFIIENFLSDFEIEKIIDTAKSNLNLSLVGNIETGGGTSSSTRTSKNAWVPRDSNFVTETVYKRAGDVLQIDESILTRYKNAEDLQVVNYQIGQKYDPHHDFGKILVIFVKFFKLSLAFAL